MAKKIVKVIAAVLVFVIAFSIVQEILTGNEDTRTEYRIKCFYDVEKDSLDAVYIGSSFTYAFWNAPYVWNEYGIAVYPYASEYQPIEAAKFIMEDALKTQPNAVYIINLPRGREESNIDYYHYLFDNMPLSKAKFDAAMYIGDAEGYTFTERMELMLPIIKYHSRWSSLVASDFDLPSNEYMTGNAYNSYLYGVEPIKRTSFFDNIPEIELEEAYAKALTDLFEYINEKDVEVLFVASPAYSKDEVSMGTQYAACRFVEEHGFDVINMNVVYDEIGIDTKTDYYNRTHTNVHGALKTSAYLAEYMVNKYGFENKRNQEAYSEWDIAFMRYYYEKLEPALTEADREYFKAPIVEKSVWEDYMANL